MRWQIIRWNKSREASTENELKQKGLDIIERMACYDSYLTPTIFYNKTDLSHLSYPNKKNKT